LAGALSWSQASGTGFSATDQVSDALVMGATIVAVGASDDAAGAGAAAAWWSTDGTVWELADALPGAAQATIESVAEGPGGLVAVGFSYAADEVRPVVWRSTDGRSWQLVEHPNLAHGEMGSVAGGPTGYVAVGTGPDAAPLVWLSVDGAEWSGAAPMAGAEAGATINGVYPFEGGFVGYGTSADGRAQLWHSADGLGWAPAEGLASEVDSSVSDVTAGDGRLVAVGAHYEGALARTLAWTSADGLSWQVQPAAELDGEMIDVERVGSGFLAVGAQPEVDELRFRAAAWVSADGSLWQQLADDSSFELGRMVELLVLGSVVVVIGERAIDPAGEELVPAVWIGR
jgi:hypothetical protein